jgi:capsular polysaccharide biosynthesis protein
VVIAILASMGFGFLTEYLDPSFKTPEEVKEYLEIPLLATLPKGNGKPRTAVQFQTPGERPC